MPITRTRSQLPASTEQALSIHDAEVDHSSTVTRSGKVIHQLYDHPEDASFRSAKRRRTESSISVAPSAPANELLDAPFEDDPAIPQLAGEPGKEIKDTRLHPATSIPPPGVRENGTTPTSTISDRNSPESWTAIDRRRRLTEMENLAESEEHTMIMGDLADQPACLGSKPLFVKTGSRMKVESLPILDNLSTQVLSTFAKSTYQETVALINEPGSEAGQEYSAIRNLFEVTKRVYTSKTSFLSPADLDLSEASQVDILRKANLATFISTVFGPQQIGFSDLNAQFLEIFVPDGGRLLKAQGSIFLELKTQAFIAAVRTQDLSKEDVLYDLFPDNLESRILSRRPVARGLAPSEQDFVKRALSRRDILLSQIKQGSLDALPDRYRWEDFLREVSSYISKNFDAINASTNSDRGRSGRLASVGEIQTLQQGQLESNFAIIPAQPPPPPPPQIEKVEELPPEDFVAKAARAAQIALQGHSMNMLPQSVPPLPMQHHVHHTPTPQPTFQQVQIQPTFQQYVPPSQSSNNSKSHNSPNYGPLPEVPHVSQTAPTQVLYERARMAATAKASPTSRRTGLPSQRRPWTTDEENALMAGLDRVRGPHWSQILAMFGPGGTINESLKDRNQVQLKDKARNLKLFFLKSGIEVPYYLKYVTGDLKTRAPAQASKNEARERERQQGEEDKAHFDGVQGIMALAGAHPQFPDDPDAIGMSDDRLSFEMMTPPLPDQMALPEVNINLDPNLSDVQLPPVSGKNNRGSLNEDEPPLKSE